MVGQEIHLALKCWLVALKSASQSQNQAGTDRPGRSVDCSGREQQSTSLSAQDVAEMICQQLKKHDVVASALFSLTFFPWPIRGVENFELVS